MASTERQAITGRGAEPQRGPGAEPLARGSGAKPHEAESIPSFTSASGAQICQFLLPCKLLKYAFWVTVCKTVRPMLIGPLSVCLSCL